MSMVVFSKIMGEISGEKRTVRLNAMGEPLLNPVFPQMLREAKRIGHTVHVTTNATLLSETLSRELLEIGIDWIGFSLDGLGEAYDRCRPGASWEKTLEHVLKFAELARESRNPPKMSVEVILSDMTEPHLADILGFWKPKGIPVGIIPLDDYCGQVKLPSHLGRCRTKDRPCPGDRPPCRLLYSVIHIGADGRVILCCHDYARISNLPSVMEKPLHLIWDQDVSRFRENHEKRLFSTFPCSRCIAWRGMQ
jgi:hypothetical protein